ncbi:SDR family oxidoreductase [Parapedobacter sp. 10938]|uniref:SDR family oxidoreductase n=1 Tax=Parapedobacter flavus TaxID=3110225 RepID=UPI002DBA1AB3|nr:SDR family oxidoreductase [Parapedobacter sp. 10938]MEC3879764.1 SDR family oxidoreductase [Parapedobacter sp. 10938]
MKSAFITGANKGIGFETAKQLLQKGVRVYLGSRMLENGLQAVEKLKAEGLTNVEVVQIDITDEDSVKNARTEIGRKTDVLDILVNNAGINGGEPPYIALESTSNQFMTAFDTNVFGVARVTKAFVDLLRKSPEPRIVNVSTSVGSLSLQSDPNWPAYDFAKYAVYGSSKAALNMYTIHLAYELRDTAFKVNAVCPGYTSTDFTFGNGGEVETAGNRIVKYTLIGQDGPTGKFFSEETNPETGEIPW